MFKHALALLALLALVATPAAAGEVEYQITPDGVVMDVFIEGNFAEFIESIPEGAGGVTVCFNSTSDLGINWFHTIDVTRSGGVVTVLSGFIDGTICDAPNWSHTGGTITATSLQFNAVYVGFSSCADELDMTGSRTPPAPRVWSGDYGFPVHSFPHDTAFDGFGPC